jgi:hypothetical protein
MGKEMTCIMSCKIILLKVIVVAHTCNPRYLRQEDQEYRTSMGYVL